MHTEAQTKDNDESLAPRGLTIRSKLLLFTTGIGFLILAALAITAFFLSAIALKNSEIGWFSVPPDFSVSSNQHVILPTSGEILPPKRNCKRSVRGNRIVVGLRAFN